MPRFLGSSLALFVLVCVYFNSEDGLEWGAVFWMLPSVAIWARTLLIRMRLDGHNLIVVSWFRRYSIPLKNIDDCLLEPYAGLMSEGQSWRGPFGFGLTMLSLEFKTARSDLELPATIMFRRTARAAQKQVRAALQSAADPADGLTEATLTAWAHRAIETLHDAGERPAWSIESGRDGAFGLLDLFYVALTRDAVKVSLWLESDDILWLQIDVGAQSWACQFVGPVENEQVTSSIVALARGRYRVGRLARTVKLTDSGLVLSR